MLYQFNCPQGHLLEAETSKAGQTATCPDCGMSFVIPPPGGAPAQALPDNTGLVGGASHAGAGVFPTGDGPPRRGRFDFLNEETSQDAPASGPSADFAALDATGGPGAYAATGAKLLTIPCPNGHYLTTPHETIGDEVICPQCGAGFVIRYDETVEYQRQKQMEQEAQDERDAKKWMTWAIVFGILVCALVLFLVAAAIR